MNKTKKMKSRLNREDIESLGFEYVGPARLTSGPLSWRDYIRYKKAWSDCPPEAHCNDHHYGFDWICLDDKLGCVTAGGRCHPELLIYKETFGGFFGGGLEDKVLFQGECPTIKELKFLTKLLKIK